MLKSMKNQSLNKCTLSNLVLTLGEEARIPGRTSPEPSEKGSAFNLGSGTVKKNNMLLVAIVKCIKGKKPSKMELFYIHAYIHTYRIYSLIRRTRL